LLSTRENSICVKILVAFRKDFYKLFLTLPFFLYKIQLHRRLLFDDAFGVGEPLNETAYGTGLVARGKHWLLVAGEGTGR